jgi:hypothetical protein
VLIGPWTSGGRDALVVAVKQSEPSPMIMLATEMIMIDRGLKRFKESVFMCLLSQ